MRRKLKEHFKFCPKLPAFTLVELMVVSAVISLIMSILLPSLGRARAKAREVVCATNMRNWGTAFYIYASDSHGTLPHTDDRARNNPPDVYSPEHPEHEYCYIDLLPPLIGRHSWRDFSDGTKPTNDIWQCPVAKILPDSAYSPQYKPSLKGYHSYAMNSYLEYDFDFGKQADTPVYASFLKLADCRAPSRTILMFEQTLDPKRGYGGQGGLSMAGRYTAEDARALSDRHWHYRNGFGSNVIILDCHLEWRNDLWDETLNNPRIPLMGDLLWFPY
jgi:prepilin-type N-terminal cleavage/methylation domain-containing protein